MNENQDLPPLPSQLEALLGVYWQAGYDEGTGHEPEVDPNETLSRICEAVRGYARVALAATPAFAEPLTDEQIDPLDWHLSAERDYEPHSGQELLVVAGTRDFARAVERACAEAWGVKLAGIPAPAPEARCQCGLKPASECEPWEPGCDLGRNPDHVLVHRVTPAQAQQAKPLTDEQFDRLFACFGISPVRFSRAIEAACAEAWGVKLAGIGASIGASSGGKP